MARIDSPLLDGEDPRGASVRLGGGTDGLCGGWGSCRGESFGLQ
jgi:hypothetical protein